jgi:MSHA biogenesis protein MshO
MLQHTQSAEKGFTLIELITVIIVLGVVSVGISGFIRTGVEIYNDTTERDQLLGDSRFVMERLTRELRMAIPNSVRVKSSNIGINSIQCIEFIPAEWVSFYTSLSVLPDVTTSATIVEFANNPVGFTLEPGDFAIVYPTNNLENNNDVYHLANGKRKNITSCSDSGTDANCDTADDPTGTATLSVSGAFKDHSPASRLYFARKAVSYCANSNRSIYRNEGDITEDQFIYSSGVLMAENINNNFSNADEAPFRVYNATLTRNSLVHILLAFERNEEVINYSNEVHVPNVP